MKKLKTIILFCFAAGFCIQFSHAQNFTKEEQAIIDFINKDAEDWFNRDYESWKENYVHDALTKHIVANKLYHHELEGWEEVDKLIGGSFKTNPEPFPKGIKKNYQIRVSGDLATVSDNSYTASDEEENEAIPQKEFYTLVKKDGSWKIVQYINTAPATYSDESLEWSLNSDGYYLLQNNKVEEAIKVFKLNTELYPESGNVWDSLGEGYMKNGDTELAIQNYEKSLEIDPSNTNAEEMLKKLRSN